MSNFNALMEQDEQCPVDHHEGEAQRNACGIQPSSSTEQVRADNKHEDTGSSKSPCMMITTSSEPLLEMDTIGIDTDSSKSMSTRVEDFIWIDKSNEARGSVDLSGVGGSNTKVGGRGPLAVKVIDSNGKSTVIIDPEGVYMLKTVESPEFRVLAQQQMKHFGCRLIQSHNGTDIDVIECVRSGVCIPLLTQNGILVCKTGMKHNVDSPVVLESSLQQVMKGHKSAMMSGPQA